ncbi:hypothetical protein DL769_010589 [Monosporascus sp. CRB-8-3]|nr:hypothetical protein DL769_010589 [Monosporascus sp. CRB-8-3]
MARNELDRQHFIRQKLPGGDLAKVPVEDVKRVLNLRTGSGIWAMEFDKLTKGAKKGISGSNLGSRSEGAPEEHLTSVPSNCTFEERDFMDPWTGSPKFYYIRSRLIFIAQSDPRRLLENSYDAFSPGGYLEHPRPIRDTALSRLLPHGSFSGAVLLRQDVRLAQYRK